MESNYKEKHESEKKININQNSSNTINSNYASSGFKKELYPSNSISICINSQNANSQNNLNNNNLNNNNLNNNNLNNNNLNNNNLNNNNQNIIIINENKIEKNVQNINSQISDINKEIIGKGGFGTVFKYMKNMNIKVADKKIEKNNEDLYNREVYYLNILKHSPIHNYIIEIYDNYQDENGDFHIIMEPYDGNLKDLMQEKFKNGFDLNIVQKIMKIINIVVRYLYEELNILHNDIKPENILYKFLDNDKEIIEIKLCDFGLVCPSQNNLITNKIEGTAIYWDSHKKEPYNKKMFLYDTEMNELKVLGNVMYELAYNSKNFEEIKNKINYIEDEDFRNIIEFTCLLPDYLKPNFLNYFNLNFFKKIYPSNNYFDSIKLKKSFEFEMEEAIDLAKKVTKYSNKEYFQKSKCEQMFNIFSVKLDKNSNHFTSFVKDSIFHVAYFENNKIKILKERQSKYSNENEIIKEIEIDKNLNVYEIKFNSFFNCVFVFSEEIKFFDVNDFNIHDLFKETKIKFASICNKNQNDFLLFVLNDDLKLFSFKIFKENNILKLEKEKYEIMIENFDKEKNLFFNVVFLNNIFYFYYYTDFKYYIYTFDENNQHQKSENKSENKIKNLLLTNIEKNIFLIFLTEKDNKYLISMQKYSDNKEKYITHNLNSEIKKIMLINNEILLVLCFSTFQLLNLKENYWILHSPYASATNQIEDCISVDHPFYKESLLVLVNENTEKNHFLLFYKTNFSDDYWKLKAYAIKSFNNEFKHADVYLYLYKTKKLNSDEIKIILRLMLLNKENIKVKNYILERKKN